MGIRPAGNEFATHRRLVNRLILACVFGLAACVGTPLFAQNSALAELDPGPIVAGARFQVTVRVPDSGLTSPQVTLPDLPSRIALVAGPEINPDTAIDEKGLRAKYQFIRYTFRAVSPGYALLPGFTVSIGNRELVSNDLVVGIAGIDSSSAIPPDLAWDFPISPVFEGESVFVTLDLHHADTISFPDKIEVSPPQGGVWEEVRGLGQIEEETLGDRVFQKIPVATFIFTPSVRGTVQIPAARVDFGTRQVSAPARTVSIAALPPELAQTGAVGSFRFDALLDRDKVPQGEQFLLTLRVEGEGNLNFLRIPEPDTGNLLTIGKSENSRAVPSENGYRGFRETVYRLSGSQIGGALITVPPFAMMSTDGTVSEIKAQTMAVSVLKSSGAGASPDGSQRFLPLSAPTIASLRPLFLSRTVLGILLFLPGVLVFLVGLSLRLVRLRRARTSLAVAFFVSVFVAARSAGALVGAWEPSIESGNAAYGRSDYESAYTSYTAALAADPESPGIMYNLALACFGKNSNAQGMFYLQGALRLLPVNPVFRQTMESYETRLGLDRQLPILALPPPDYVLAGVASVFTLAALVFLLAGGRLRSYSLIAVTVLAILAAGGLGLLVYENGQANAQVGVISETGAPMKKIPDRNASSWLSLPSGTTVLVSVQSGNFFLVQTAYGIKGWVDASSLYSSEAGQGKNGGL